MIFVASFALFLFFAGAMALSMIIKKRPLKTEDEATAAILDSMSCATCHSTLCGYAGKSGHTPKANCQGANASELSIPHKAV